MEVAVELTPAQRRTLEGLIGAGERPVFSHDLAQRLRDRIEEAVRTAEPERSMWVGKSLLNDLQRCPGLFDAVRSGEREPFAFSSRFAAGRLAHKAIELEVAGREDRDPHALASAAVERLGEDEAFSAFWGELDDLRRDETLMEAAKTLELFRSTMPPLRRMRRELSPSTEWNVRVELLGGALVLSGTMDLVIGAAAPAEPGRATRLVIDLKTGKAWPEHAEDMRFYALLLTLRFGTPPYRVATLYLDSGEWQAEDVDLRMLERAAERIIEAVRTASAADRGHPRPVRPGPYCTWCPRAATCPSSTAPSAATA
ncbi:MAG TPA: PD-(D/E)XK nuclease family protein [Actinomycetota bacterium]|nr:PD-(D/E)XK nuclease family protein [Actinomycetota bacterium]